MLINSDMRVKLSDFGLACKLKNSKERRNESCGTPNYMAPEYFDKKNGHTL